MTFTGENYLNLLSGPDWWKTLRNDEILTISELAELLKIAQRTVYALSQRREIPAFKVGGQWRFSRAAIDAWIEARTRASMEPERATGLSRAEVASPRRRRR